MNLQFRPMIYKDISAVYKIERLLFNDPWPKKSFRTEIRQNNISYPFIVEENNEIIGYIICWYYKVLEYFSDYNKAFLEVRESNKKAINLYTAFGFEAIYRRRAYYSNGEDALVMIKNCLINH